MAKKNSNSRVNEETSEKKETVGNEVPENRMQTDQQIATTSDALDTKPEDGSFQKKTIKGKGSSLKQEKISDALTGSNATAGMGIIFAGRGVSGTAGGVLGSNSSTPVAKQSRSDSRPGKKLDRLATKINYTPSEQVILAVDESKPLADSADQDQGFNGTYRNETARSQKIMGAVPGDLMFQRSVDLIMKDKLYFLEGQAVFQAGDSRTSYFPSQNYDPENDTYVSYENAYGDYIHRALHIGFNKNGKVRYGYFEVEDITPDNIADEIVNQASAHRLIKSNTAELDRINMDAKAGDEKAEIWSPMPRAYIQPTQIAAQSASMEAETGGYTHLAYSKASTNMAYQMNRAVKDGLDEITPAIEQCVGWQDTDNNNKDINTAYSNSLDNCFTTAQYQAGSPALMIAAYDSVNKYHNKADLLLQPRGWRMHLQTADNNMNAFKVPSEYANVFAGQETFSTIDHEYDELMPICMTDKANLITATNMNVSSAFVQPDFTFTYSSTNIESDYQYNNIVLIPQYFMNNCRHTNLYIYEKHTDGDGLVFSSGVISLDPDSSTNTGTQVDIIIKTAALSAADLAVGGAYEGFTLLQNVTASSAYSISLNLPVTQNEGAGLNDNRISSVSYDFIDDDTIWFKNGGVYVCHYHDLRNNYSVQMKHPLVFGIYDYLNNKIGGKISSLLKGAELFVPFVFSTQYMTLAQLLICAATPNITNVRLNSMKDVIYYEDNIHEYPFSKLSSLKDVPFKSYINFNFSDYDHPLECKVMNPSVAIQWIMPEFFWKVDTHQYVMPWYFNENELLTTGAPDYDAACMSFPSIRSGIRLGVLDTLYGMSEKDVRLSLDRMCKDIFHLASITAVHAYKYGRMTDGQPVITTNADVTIANILSTCRELGLVVDAPLGVLTKDINDSGYYKAFTADGTSTSYRIKFWTNINSLETPSILSSGGTNINRAANYVQKWFEITANLDTANTAITGLVFGMNDEVSDATYSPFADLGTGAQAASQPTIISYQRSIWTRLQLLPFVLSPFDGTCSTTNPHDIYDIGYYFGLCGFRASDYRESVYNREKEVVNQGMLFVQDPWILASPIIKYAANDTGISETKGYKI